MQKSSDRIKTSRPFLFSASQTLLLLLCAVVLLSGCGNRSSANQQPRQAKSETLQVANHTTREEADREEFNSRQVFINRVRLTDPQVQALERGYRVRIQDGSYWYDRVCGAWGLEGGPTLGFALPGLDLGGRLRAVASNGDTGVFVNGRELHRLDVAALQQLGPVYQGRYWLDAEGYCGFEGEPAFCNLVQLARAAGGSSSGGQKTSALSTWDRTGVAVFDLR